MPALAVPPVQTDEVVYRVAGHDPALGACTGLLRVDGARVWLELPGQAPRDGAGLALRTGPEGEVQVADGAGLELRGRRLELSREADLRPHDPTGRGAALLASVRAARGGTLVGTGGAPLRWVAFEARPERAALVVVPGRTEAAERYAELAADLVPLGYTLLVLDLRGQGRSGRLLGQGEPPGSPERQKGHVERFEDYVADMGLFLRAVARATPGRRVVALGHSLGGAILARRAELHPGELDALVLSSPMLRIAVEGLAAAYVRLQLLLGRGEAYVRGEGPDASARTPFAGNRTSHSEPRFRWKNEQLLAGDPELLLGGPTYRWVHEALRGTRAAREEAWRLRTPTLLLQSSDDRVVVNSGQDELVAAAPPGVVTKVVIEGALHELLLESDQYRAAALLQLVAFLDHHTR